MALSFVRFSHDYDEDEKAAREAKPACGRAPSSRHGTGASQQEDGDSRRRQAAAERARHPAGVGLGTGPRLADAPSRATSTVRANALSQADQPLVRADQDANIERHALVLLDRGAEAPAAARPSDNLGRGRMLEQDRFDLIARSSQFRHPEVRAQRASRMSPTAAHPSRRGQEPLLRMTV